MSLNLTPSPKSKANTNFHLHLIIGCPDAILEDRDLHDVVEGVLKRGKTVIVFYNNNLICVGASIVQYCEKNMEAKEMVEQAERMRDLCHKYKAKFVIKGRVDVAVAANADGVHLDRTGISIKVARRIFGDDRMIGITLFNRSRSTGKH